MPNSSESRAGVIWSGVIDLEDLDGPFQVGVRLKDQGDGSFRLEVSLDTRNDGSWQAIDLYGQQLSAITSPADAAAASDERANDPLVISANRLAMLLYEKGFFSERTQENPMIAQDEDGNGSFKATVVCTDCGRIGSSGDNYCSNCGRKLDKPPLTKDKLGPVQQSADDPQQRLRRFSPVFQDLESDDDLTRCFNSMHQWTVLHLIRASRNTPISDGKIAALLNLLVATQCGSTVPYSVDAVLSELESSFEHLSVEQQAALVQILVGVITQLKLHDRPSYAECTPTLYRLYARLVAVSPKLASRTIEECRSLCGRFKVYRDLESGMLAAG